MNNTALFYYYYSANKKMAAPGTRKSGGPGNAVPARRLRESRQAQKALRDLLSTAPKTPKES